MRVPQPGSVSFLSEFWRGTTGAARPARQETRLHAAYICDFEGAGRSS